MLMKSRIVCMFIVLRISYGFLLRNIILQTLKKPPEITSDVVFRVLNCQSNIEIHFPGNKSENSVLIHRLHEAVKCATTLYAESSEEIFSTVVSQRRVLAILDPRQNITTDQCLIIMRNFWRHNDILESAIYMSPNNVVLYNPFTDTITHSRAKWNITHFDNYFLALTRNLHGYLIKIADSYWEPYSFPEHDWFFGLCFRGPDICTRDVLQRHLNFTMDLINPLSPGFGNFLPNGTLSGLSGEVAYGRVDVAFNIRMLLPVKMHLVEFSYVVYFDKLVVLVKKAPKAPHYRKILFTFSIRVWILILFALLMFPLAWSRSWALLANVYLITWGNLLLQSTSRGNTATNSKILYLHWLLFSLVMSTAFTAGFTGHLVTDEYLPNINTVNELIKNNMRILVVSSVSENDFSAKLKGRMQYAKNDKKVLDEILMLEGYAAFSVGIKSEWNQRRPKFLNNGVPKFHIMKEELKEYIGVYEMRKRWPLIPLINSKLAQLTESGLLKWWHDLAKFRANIDGVLIEVKSTETKKACALTWAHLEVGFILLGIGFAIATPIFFIELFLSRKHVQRWMTYNSKRREQKWIHEK